MTLTNKQTDLLNWTCEARLTIALLGLRDARERQQLKDNQEHRFMLFDDSETLFAYCDSCRVDAVLLGIYLEQDGNIAREILPRLTDPERYSFPVLISAPCLTETCIADAISMGASDFIFPPLNPTELVARVRAARRKELLKASQVQHFAPYCFDLPANQLYIDDAPVNLTTREFSLALYLFHHAGELILRKQILSDIWGIASDIDTRRVDTYISRIRSKLGLNSEDSLWRLNSVYQKGYILEKLSQNAQ
ncbi:response regulator transcription factor [Granulosicoccaceae sp. 1_MG-2023]|nr:response regulator transcription factor [Granulosicoccaceae sp. 1_MG-2023]